MELKVRKKGIWDAGLRRGRLSRALAATLLLLFTLSHLTPPTPLYAETFVSDAPSTLSEDIESDPETDTLTDHKAKVFNVTGKVLVKREGAADWETLREGDEIDEGDAIKTDSDSSAEIYYDEFYLNYIRIEADSEMTFNQIEPTSLKLDEGALFSNLDGLISGTEYEIVTPTSISAVRGTRFLREYNSQDSSDNTLVSEGTVDVNPFLDDRGTIDAKQVFQVTADQSMFFDAQSVRQRKFNHLKPKQFEPQQRQRLKRMRDDAQQRLHRFAGGSEKVQRAQKRFDQVRKDPHRANHVRQKLQQARRNPRAHLNNPGHKSPQARNRAQMRQDSVRKHRGEQGMTPKRATKMRQDFKGQNGDRPFLNRKRQEKDKLGPDRANFNARRRQNIQGQESTKGNHLRVKDRNIKNRQGQNRAQHGNLRNQDGNQNLRKSNQRHGAAQNQRIRNQRPQHSSRQNQNVRNKPQNRPAAKKVNRRN